MINSVEFDYLFENISERAPYEDYLSTHISNVCKAFNWLEEHLPALLSEQNYADEHAYYGELKDVIAKHDGSKYNSIPDRENYYELKCEYDQYADYFYGEKTLEVKIAFDYAWLSHIHDNPHHWQHWLLHNDDPNIGLHVLDMPYVFIIEMICDWWSFGWKQNKLDELFTWYENNKSGIILSPKTRKTVEHILDEIKKELNNK